MNIIIGSTTVTVDDDSTNERATEQGITPEQWWANNIMGLNNQFVAADQVEDMQEIGSAFAEASPNTQDQIKNLLGLSVIILLAITASVLLAVHSGRVIARKASLVTCSAFATQQIAQNAYNTARTSGSPAQIKIYSGLDRNHDGVACNDLK